MGLPISLGDSESVTLLLCDNGSDWRRDQLFFYAGDKDEPSHVHVDRDNCEAKFWLDPLRLARSHGFAASEISNVEKLIRENQQHLLDSWNEFFNG